jgi:hypothetical protein
VWLSVLVALLLVIQPAPWWARMTLWLHALGLPCLALVLSAASHARRPAGFLAPVLFIVLLGIGGAESRGAFEAERANGRAAGTNARGAVYRSSAEQILPGLERECAAFLSASRIARGPWSRFGTLLGGVLALPLDARVITPIAAADSAGIDALRAKGVQWVVWDEVRAPVPPALREAATDSCAFRPHPDQRFLMLKLTGPDLGTAAGEPVSAS